MRTVTLQGKGGFKEWRNAARALMTAGIAPQEIVWEEEGARGSDLFGPCPPSGEMPLSADASAPRAAAITVPQGFLTLAEAVICHRDPIRFLLLYRVLWRLQQDRNLLSVPSDIDVALLLSMEKAVRRDSHKMKAFVRFKEIVTDSPEGEPLQRRRFYAWFEPDHHIVARVAAFFQRRFTDMDWIIATPKGSALWDGERVAISSEPAENRGLDDMTDDLWRIYFSNIFNPARLKVKAMQAEMPKKYWKNLPEAGLIPGLIAGAQGSVLDMAQRPARAPRLFHQRLQAARAVAQDSNPVCDETGKNNGA